jgi:hypothetical protein
MIVEGVDALRKDWMVKAPRYRFGQTQRGGS